MSTTSLRQHVQFKISTQRSDSGCWHQR